MAVYEGSIFVTKEKVQDVFDKLRSHDLTSSFCFDCGAEDATWVSVPFAVMLCLSCSNIHRTMDVEITYVKSSIIDQWTVNNLRRFKYGGNQKAHDYFTLHNADKLLQGSVKEKYTNEVATKYRHHIDNLVKRDTTQHPFEIRVATKSFDNESSESFKSEENNDYGSGDDLFAKDWGEPLRKVGEGRTLNAHILQEPKKYSILSSNRKPREKSRNEVIHDTENDTVNFDKERKEEKNQDELPKSFDLPSPLSLDANDNDEMTALYEPYETLEEYKRLPRLSFGMVENDANMLISDRSHRDKRTSISSDDYFKNQKIENEDEAKSHLKNYSKATSISSTEYFNDNWNHSNDSFQNHTLNSNDFNIQSDSAKYFRSKKGHQMKTNEGLNRVESGFDVFSSNREQDLNMIKNSVQNGARRLSDYLRDYMKG